MLPVNPWEHHNAIKTLYTRCMEPVCAKHRITRMELDILLFLANNPLFDTASDIVEIRYLSKSQVSAAVKELERKGLIEKGYLDGNRKTMHLGIKKKASGMIEDGKAAQERFLRIMFQGIPEEEIERMKKWNGFILGNIHRHLKEETE